MRAKQQFRMMLVAALAVLAVTAVAATAAQAATEGPFYKIAGTRLATGETKSFSAKAVPYTISAEAIDFKVDCLSTSYAKGAKIVGSSGANASGAEVTLEFKNCTTQGMEQCEVENNSFKSTPLTGTLGYATSTRTGKLLELFKPTTGKKFATIKLIGSGLFCTPTNEVEGGYIGQIGTETSAIEVGAETKGVKSPFAFPSVGLDNSIWIEKAGALTKTARSLVIGGGAVTLLYSSTAQLELEGLSEWGVFTK
jgi:hypothetical protein